MALYELRTYTLQVGKMAKAQSNERRKHTPDDDEADRRLNDPQQAHEDARTRNTQDALGGDACTSQSCCEITRRSLRHCGGHSHP
jgi:hypothetical protein